MGDILDDWDDEEYDHEIPKIEAFSAPKVVPKTASIFTTKRPITPPMRSAGYPQAAHKAAGIVRPTFSHASNFNPASDILNDFDEPDEEHNYDDYDEEDHDAGNHQSEHHKDHSQEDDDDDDGHNQNRGYQANHTVMNGHGFGSNRKSAESPPPPPHQSLIHPHNRTQVAPRAVDSPHQHVVSYSHDNGDSDEDRQPLISQPPSRSSSIMQDLSSHPSTQQKAKKHIRHEDFDDVEELELEDENPVEHRPTYGASADVHAVLAGTNTKGYTRASDKPQHGSSNHANRGTWDSESESDHVQLKKGSTPSKKGIEPRTESNGRGKGDVGVSRKKWEANSSDEEPPIQKTSSFTPKKSPAPSRALQENFHSKAGSARRYLEDSDNEERDEGHELQPYTMSQKAHKKDPHVARSLENKGRESSPMRSSKQGFLSNTQAPDSPMRESKSRMKQVQNEAYQSGMENLIQKSKPGHRRHQSREEHYTNESDHEVHAQDARSTPKTKRTGHASEKTRPTSAKASRRIAMDEEHQDTEYSHGSDAERQSRPKSRHDNTRDERYSNTTEENLQEVAEPKKQTRKKVGAIPKIIIQDEATSLDDEAHIPKRKPKTKKSVERLRKSVDVDEPADKERPKKVNRVPLETDDDREIHENTDEVRPKSAKKKKPISSVTRYDDVDQNQEAAGAEKPRKQRTKSRPKRSDSLDHEDTAEEIPDLLAKRLSITAKSEPEESLNIQVAKPQPPTPSNEIIPDPPVMPEQHPRVGTTPNFGYVKAHVASKQAESKETPKDVGRADDSKGTQKKEIIAQHEDSDEAYSSGAASGDKKLKKSTSLSKFKKFVKNTFHTTEHKDSAHTDTTPVARDSEEIDAKAEHPHGTVVLDSRKKPTTSATHHPDESKPREESKAKEELARPSTAPVKSVRKSGSLSKFKDKFKKPKPPVTGPGPLFGGRIEDSPTFSEVNPKLPLFIERAVEYLGTEGTHIEGIFRISGSQLKIAEAKQKAEKKFGALKFHKLNDAHVASGLLKLYFRELKEPLFPYACHDSFLKAMDGFSQDSSEINFVSTICGYASTWSKTRRAVFVSLFQMLSKLSSSSSITKMDANNLGTVIGPSLFCLSSSHSANDELNQLEAAKEASRLMAANMKKVASIVSFIIAHIDTIEENMAAFDRA